MTDTDRVSLEICRLRDHEIARVGRTLKRASRLTAARRRSCPTAWCSFVGAGTTISGFGRIDHAAMAGSVTSGSSLNCATLSSVM